MNLEETALLLTFAAAFDRRTVGEADVRAWQAVLAGVDHQQAQAAVAAHYGDCRDWIMPADIKRRVAGQRADAARDVQGPGQPAEIPDADPDDVPAYLAALRAQRTRAAIGQPTRLRPVAELTAGVGREVPAEHQAVRRPGPLGIICPHCSAPVGHSCRTTFRGRRMADVHPARLTASRAA